MQIEGKIVVVTGGASGIGRALCESFASDGAAAVVVVDLDADGAAVVADAVGGLAIRADVADETAVVDLVAETQRQLGPIDLFCSNAGVAYSDGPGGTAASASNEAWERSWQVNLMAQVYAARAVLPGMIERGAGYLLNTVSAAGLLNQIGDAAYSTTKHAAIGFAESLAITHGDDGIRVSVICPQYVATGMTAAFEHSGLVNTEEVLTPEAVADCVMEGIESETFLILPHPIVQTYMQRKVDDYDRWLGGMRKLRRNLLANRT